MRTGGWLLLLCAFLVVWTPVELALSTAGALHALPLRGVGLGAILVLRLGAGAIGIAAGLALLGRRPGAITLTKASLAVSAAVDALTYVTPYFPNNRPPGDSTLFFLASMICYAAWFAYLSRSKQVEAIYL